MRKLMAVLLAVLALFSLTVMVGAQDEEDETPTLSIPFLADGEAVEAEFVDSSMQLFAFLGTEGDEVTVSMVQDENTDIDPFLVLLGPSGELLAYNDDSESSDDLFLASGIENVELPETGTYLVVATLLGELGTPTITEDSPLDEPAAYTVTVSGFTTPDVEDPAADDIFGFIVEPEEGSDTFSVGGTVTLDAERPVAYVFFPALEGQTISLATAEAEDSENPLSDPMAYIFDASGRRIAGADDTEGLFPQLSVEAPEDGVYVAFVTAYGFQYAVEFGDDYLGVGDVLVGIATE
jgi:hypothetical protein